MIDLENVEKFAQDHDVPFSNYASLARAPEVQALIQAEVDRVNAKFARVEQIKKFCLLETQLSAEDEELTPTMKLKRKLVEAKYARAHRGHVRAPDRDHRPTPGDHHEAHDSRCRLPPRWPLRRALAGAAEQQGVSKDEIVVGSIQDLVGPDRRLRQAGAQRHAAARRRDQRAGRHQRQEAASLIVEDSGYDPKKAVLAAQKLVNQDKIFIMVGHIGTAQNMAAMPVQFEKNVVNFFPITAAREMYEPFNRLKYSFAATYYDQMRTALPKLVKEKGAKKVCTIYQDDEFGLEVLRGAEAGAEDDRHGARREDQLQARRDRLLVAGRADEGRRLRLRGARHDHPRDHRHRSARRARPASARPSWDRAQPTPT